MTNTALNTTLRNDVLRTVMELVSKHYDVDSLAVSTSAFTIPVVDAEGNEKFAKITVSIPRGTRNGDGGYDEYDGYAEADNFRMDQEDKAAKKAKREAEKEAERAKREAKKAEKESAE